MLGQKAIGDLTVSTKCHHPGHGAAVGLGPESWLIKIDTTKPADKPADKPAPEAATRAAGL